MGPIMGGVNRLKYSGATVNIACDGNSLSTGFGGSSGYTPYPTILAALPPLNGAVNVSNVGVAGQTTRQMNGLDGSWAGDIDNCWVNGKTNILIAWEGTNSICNTGASAAQAIQDMVDYIAARKALHPWRVILITCLPRQTNAGNTLTVAQNAKLDAYNQYMREHYRDMGAEALVELRQPGSVFNPANYSDQAFATMASSTGLWASGEDGNHIHLNTEGYVVMAPRVAEVLKRLPAR